MHFLYLMTFYVLKNLHKRLLTLDLYYDIYSFLKNIISGGHYDKKNSYRFFYWFCFSKFHF